MEDLPMPSQIDAGKYKYLFMYKYLYKVNK